MQITNNQFNAMLTENTMRRYQLMLDNYDEKLKAEKIAMLEGLKSYIELMASLETDLPFAEGEKYCAEIIQQKIDKLKEAKNE